MTEGDYLANPSSALAQMDMKVSMAAEVERKLAKITEQKARDQAIAAEEAATQRANLTVPYIPQSPTISQIIAEKKISLTVL